MGKAKKRVLESPGGPALRCLLESKRRRVWGRSLSVSLSVNRPFLPLLQMSESETLISMVNRMVESSSPRAQLFMQVRPVPGSMVSVSCLCMVESTHLGRGLLARPIHLPGLIARLRLDSLLQFHCVSSILHVHGSIQGHFPDHQSSRHRHPMPARDCKSAFECLGLLFCTWCLLHRHYWDDGCGV